MLRLTIKLFRLLCVATPVVFAVAICTSMWEIADRLEALEKRQRGGIKR